MSGKTQQSLAEKRERKGMSSLSKFYLVAYNSVQAAGWSYILFQTLRIVLVNRSAVGLWDACGNSLLLFQSLAALEVLHCIVRLVPSSPVVTGMQVFSRLFQVWGILYLVPEIHNSLTVPLLTFAWGVTEVVRYSFYCLNVLNISPKFLTWCRYSLFLGLYPTGVIAEVGNILQSLSTIKKKQLLSISLPNVANISFSYYYYCIFLILTYFPLFPQLFNHMRKQRRKVLGGKKEE